MGARADLENKIDFDLTALSGPARVDLKSTRRWDWVTLGAGVAIFVAGIVAIPLTKSRGGSYWIAGAVLAVAGASVVGTSWYQLKYWLHYPAVLTVGPTGILLSGSSPETRFVNISLEWADPKLRFNLIDRRGMPTVAPNGRPISRFSIMTNSQVSIDIPPLAFELIREASGAHRLDVRGVTVPVPMAGGSYVRYTVRPSRGGSRRR